MEDIKLNSRQKDFAEAYATNGGNATKAAVSAGYSVKTAASAGVKLKNNEKIRKAIAIRRTEEARKLGMSKSQVTAHLKDIINANISEFVTIKDGITIVTDTDKIPERTMSAIARIVQGKFGPEITMHDKVKALDMLGRHTGFYEKDNEQQNAIKFDLSRLTKKEKTTFLLLYNKMQIA